ncbi:MAG: hypothetical protein WAO78_06935 [Roseovarius sp.]
MSDDFLIRARDVYVAANAGTLQWVLDRPRRHGAFLDTKMNSITLQDFPESDLWRGPRSTYGWIQGRGLEALVTHAVFFEAEDPELARRLHAAARHLYTALADLHDRYGAAFFTYDEVLSPVFRNADGAAEPQATGTPFVTYSDLFVIKGLIRAATEYDPERRPDYLARLAEIVEAIEHGRFVMDEAQRLTPEAAAVQAPEFGPRMIAMGAAGMLVRLGLRDQAGFGDRFISHVLEHHLDLETGLIRDAEGGDRANVGHALEFAGFAFEYLPEDADSQLVNMLCDIARDAFGKGFAGPGLNLHVIVSTGDHASPNFPWWSLPEAMRAAAFGHARTGRSDLRDVWMRAHEAFFTNYWRGTPAVAYQTRTLEGPHDFVPATSDLDPGYHTGLSLLGTIEAINDLR